MADETKLCLNCKRDISVANFVMHEMHCRRHIVLCEHCGEPVNRTELEQHFNDLHAKIPCEKCKQMVSKPDMSKHLANDCSKKMERCEFCELTLPRNELEAHLDYCGSRTDSCPLCKQYIMQKDKLRHESSRCTYPEVRSQPVDFDIGELQQLMTNTVLGNRGSTSTNFRRGKIPAANRKSELNAQRAKNLTKPEVPGNSLNSIPPDVDYDTMLALQLAHEDWMLDGAIDNDDGNMGYESHYLGDNSPGVNEFRSLFDDSTDQWSVLVSLNKPETASLDSQNNVEDENMSIPCEFCEAEVPLNIYILHMDSCPQALQRRAADLNNEQVPVQQISSKAAIPVINNLRPLNFSPEYHTAPDDDDDVMLPCEFCQEMFPSDLIIPHQSVCQADGVLTPRATTPPRHPSNVALRQQPSNQMSFKPSIRSPPKHHNDPNEADFLGQDDNSEIANGDLSNCRLQKFKESSSNKYSPAYNRFDEALTRPPRRSARQHSVPSVDTTEPRRESRSVQRTRASLSQLLQEDTSPEALDLVETKKEPVALGGYGGHNINRAEPKERKTKVDSRTVVRRLEESRQKPAQGSSGRRSLPQTALNTPSGDQTSQPSRTRQRADHVFSPELRLKPNSTTLPKKR